VKADDQILCNRTVVLLLKCALSVEIENNIVSLNRKMAINVNQSTPSQPVLRHKKMAQESHLMSVARPSASPHDATTARLAEGLPLRPSFPRDYEDLASRPSVVHEKQVSSA